MREGARVFRQNRSTQHAIAALSRLAELYGDPGRRVSSIEIAATRNLPKPVVAKILTILAQAGLVAGSPGPGGGYRLAKPPGEISLQDVVELFEREDDSNCPFGPGWCGNREPCPLHDRLIALRELVDNYLKKTHFDIFQSKVESSVRSVRAKSLRRSRGRS